MGRMKKEEMVDFLVDQTKSPREDFDAMNIAELSSMMKQVKMAVKEHEENQHAGISTIRPGEEKPPEVSTDGLRAKIDAGKVKVGKNYFPASAIVAYKGRDVHPRTGAHQMLVQNPERDGTTIVTFEHRKDVFEGYPVAIVPDWRVRAQVLLKTETIVINLTKGIQQTRVHRRSDYVTPLDLTPDKGLVERMASYMRGLVSVADENEQLAASIANELIPTV